MSKAHYFLFTCGDAWEFGVTALGVSDRPVDVKLWHQHLQDYREALRKRSAPAAGAEFDAWYAAGGYDKLERWRRRNAPHRSFARAHGMRLVPYTSLHDLFA